MRLLTLFSVLFLSGLAAADNRVLVLLENLTVKETHSIFFKSLQESGLELTYKVADDSSLHIKKYGQFLYDHIIVFSPSELLKGGVAKPSKINCGVISPTPGPSQSSLNYV